MTSPPMTPPMPCDAALVGDHRHAVVERVGLAVERQDRLAGSREAHGEIAGELVGVEDVQRPVEIEGDVNW